VDADEAYQNARRNSDKAAARLEHDRALRDALVGMLKDHTELFKPFAENPSFKQWLSDTFFGATCEGTGV
jgi:type I restriction enzyme, R subunit